MGKCIKSNVKFVVKLKGKKNLALKLDNFLETRWRKKTLIDIRKVYKVGDNEIAGE
jgi:hypothetical protein